MTRSLIDLLEVNLEEPVQSNYKKLYCDMDGVLTDFDARFEHFSGMMPKEYESKYGSGPFWNLIDNEVGIKFWSEMDWMPGGKELWDYIKHYNPTILTSPSRQNTSRLGKNIWVKNNLQPLPKVIFAYSKNKQEYAKDSILIDDKPSNLSEWTNAGGKAIKCVNGNIAPVLKELQKLGY